MARRTKDNRKIVPPVFANRGIQSWYQAQLDKIVDMAHSDLMRVLHAVYATTAAPAIGYASDAPDRVTKIDKALTKWATEWQGRFDKLSSTLAKTFAARSFRATEYSMAGALKRAGFTVEFKPTRASVQAYKVVAAENVGLIKSIPQQYLKDVQAKVWESVKAGADMSELSQDLRDTYGVTTRRAALIARDQNNKAKAVIENTRRQQLGIVEAIWQHSHAGKEPRPTHVAMNGKTYKLSEGMYDSAEKKYIWPGQLVNCRCTSRAIIPVGT